MGKKGVAQQHGQLRPPLGVAGGPGTAEIGAVQHIVMDEGGHVDQFHDHGQIPD